MFTVVQRTEAIVRERMSRQAAGHGIDHVLRVLKLARRIQAAAGGDLLTIELAALLHDLGDAKFHQGVERSGEFAEEILAELQVSSDRIEHVSHIVEHISFRKETPGSALSLEGQVVQDADRLDALGAIGIVRTIEYNAFLGRAFYDPDMPENLTGLGHFDEKLFQLTSLMNTVMGKNLAKEREQFMRHFVAQFRAEHL